jgi:tryptophan synthase alpha chain
MVTEIKTNRLQDLFRTKKKEIINVYCTAGFPERDSTLEVMRALQQSGADIIELGIPYSDPLADGPVIQASSSRALQNGMSIPVLLQQLKDFRKDISIPVVLMGYLNPVLQYGFEKFCRDAAAAGVDALILPDLPMYEFEKEYKAVLERYGLQFIFLVTPETPTERIRKLDALSTGFLYAVSSSSTTGGNQDFSFAEAYLRRLKELQLKNPFLVGFGIRDRKSFETACRYAQGAIIGTAYIQAIEHAADVQTATAKFLNNIKTKN